MRTLTKTKEQVKKMTQKEFQDLLVANTEKKLPHRKCSLYCIQIC